MRAVLALVTAFWSLSKAGQDAVLWSMQHPIWELEDDGSSSLGSESEDSSSCSHSHASSGKHRQALGLLALVSMRLLLLQL